MTTTPVEAPLPPSSEAEHVLVQNEAVDAPAWVPVDALDHYKERGWSEVPQADVADTAPEPATAPEAVTAPADVNVETTDAATVEQPAATPAKRGRNTDPAG